MLLRESYTLENLMDELQKVCDEKFSTVKESFEEQ